MLRIALLLVAALAAPAAAQPPVPMAVPAPPVPLAGPPPAVIAPAQPPVAFGGPPPNPALVIAKVDQGKLLVTDTKFVPVAKEVVAVVKTPDGKLVQVKKVVVTHEVVSVTRAVLLSGVKATTAAGKEVPADKLADLLKDETVVMLGHVPLSEKLRKALKDDVLCLTVPMPVVAPGGTLLPPPPPPPPAPLPPGLPQLKT